MRMQRDPCGCSGVKSSLVFPCERRYSSVHQEETPMRTTKIGLLGIMIIGVCTAAALAQQGGGAPGGGRGGGRGGAAAGGGLVSMPVLMPEPSDKAVIFTKADLEKKYG